MVIEQVTKDRIKQLKEQKGYTYDSLANEIGMCKITLSRICNDEGYNTSVETIRKIAAALGTDENDLLGGSRISKNEFLGINGFVEYKGKVYSIKSFSNLKTLFEEVNNDIETPRKVRELRKLDKQHKKSQSKDPIDIKTITLHNIEEYDTNEVCTWSFRKADDEVNELSNSLGNMCKGYPFMINGEKFLNSEAAYICGMFSTDSEKDLEIQRELQAEASGYVAKKSIRRKYESVGLSRKDWNDYNTQWMLYVVWQKVKQNKKFQELLSAIPSNAIIVENSTHQRGETATFWGMKNKELEDGRDLLEVAVEVENPNAKKKELATIKMKERNSIHHIGKWEGTNCMGKILTICKHCLEDGTEPQIDYELLRNKEIYLMGKVLTFDMGRL